MAGVVGAPGENGDILSEGPKKTSRFPEKFEQIRSKAISIAGAGAIALSASVALAEEKGNMQVASLDTSGTNPETTVALTSNAETLSVTMQDIEAVMGDGDGVRRFYDGIVNNELGQAKNIPILLEIFEIYIYPLEGQTQTALTGALLNLFYSPNGRTYDLFVRGFSRVTDGTTLTEREIQQLTIVYTEFSEEIDLRSETLQIAINSMDASIRETEALIAEIEAENAALGAENTALETENTTFRENTVALNADTEKREDRVVSLQELNAELERLNGLMGRLVASTS